MTLVIWSALAVLVVVFLAGYAALLMLRLKKQTEKKNALDTQHQQNLIRKNIDVLSSINIISKAMGQKQCEISEGCWRISVLAESLPEYKQQFIDNYPSVFQLYNAIKHMPILDARKKLSKKDKLKLDLERMKIEQQLEEAVMSDVIALETFTTSTKESLQQQII